MKRFLVFFICLIASVACADVDEWDAISISDLDTWNGLSWSTEVDTINGLTVDAGGASCSAVASPSGANVIETWAGANALSCGAGSADLTYSNCDVEGTNIVNADYSTSGLCGFGSEGYRSQTDGSANDEAYIQHNPADMAIAYFRFYFYVAAENLADGETAQIMRILNGGEYNEIKLEQQSSTLGIIITFNNVDVTCQSYGSYSMGTGSSNIYRMEVLTDNTNDLYGFRLYEADGGTPVYSCSGSTTYSQSFTYIDYFGVFRPDNDRSTDIVWGYWAIDDAGWIGP